MDQDRPACAEGPLWGRNGAQSGSARLFRVTLCVLASLMTLAASPRSGPSRAAHGRLSADPPGVLQIEPRVSLAKVAASEILPASSHAVSMGTWRAGNASMGSGAFRARIVRRLPVLWRMRLPEGLTVDQIDVRYEVTAPDGRPGRLVAVDGPQSEVRTELHAVGPFVVSRDADGAIVEGGLTLYLDLASVRMAGRYTGTLTVTLNHL